jgi:hypothetical protein
MIHPQRQVHVDELNRVQERSPVAIEARIIKTSRQDKLPVHNLPSV